MCMEILAINTGLPQTEIVLLNGERTVFSKSWPSNYDEAEKLLPQLKKILAGDERATRARGGKKDTGAGAATAAITAAPDKIFVVAGPGAFTGLRVGVTIANTLAFVYQVPIISCTTFEYFQHKIPQKLAPRTAVMMRAGSGVALQLPSKSASRKTRPANRKAGTPARASQKIHHIATEEIENFLKRHTSIQYIASDIRPEARQKYALSKGVQWLDFSKMKDFADVVRELLKEDRPEHKFVKPQYPAPPHITKSKSHLKGTFLHL